MTLQEKEYYEQIRRRFEDEQKIAKAVKWAIYVMLAGLVLGLVLNSSELEMSKWMSHFYCTYVHNFIFSVLITFGLNIVGW